MITKFPQRLKVLLKNPIIYVNKERFPYMNIHKERENDKIFCLKIKCVVIKINMIFH